MLCRPGKARPLDDGREGFQLRELGPAHYVFLSTQFMKILGHSLNMAWRASSGLHSPHGANDMVTSTLPKPIGAYFASREVSAWASTSNWKGSMPWWRAAPRVWAPLSSRACKTPACRWWRRRALPPSSRLKVWRMSRPTWRPQKAWRCSRAR